MSFLEAAVVELDRDFDLRTDYQNLGELLVSAAHRFPDRGVRYLEADAADGTGLCAYPDLLRQSSRLLHGLRAAGAAAGRPVVLLLEHAQDCVTAAWACLLGGMPVCPVMPIRSDAQLLSSRLGQLDEVLDGPLYVTTARLRREFPVPAGLEVLCLEDLGAREGDVIDFDVADFDEADLRDCRPQDAALLLTTSGSTGAPKVVELTHANLLAAVSAKASALELSDADVTLNWISFDHVAAFEGHLLPLYLGASQLQVRTAAVVGEPLRLLRMIDAHRVTWTFAPNFLLGLLNKALGDPPADFQVDLSSLRRLISGGEANPVATGVAFLDRLAEYGLDRRALWPAFGMTETCAGCIFNADFPEGDAGAEHASVGRPAAGLRIRVQSADSGAVLPAGRIGEVQLSGPMITHGYRNNAEATAEAFTEDGWFRTGDLGRIDDGRLTLVGRIKDSIIVNGVNYRSSELEAVLGALDGVDPRCVVVFPTRPAGADTEQVAVAFAATAPDDPSTLYRTLMTIRDTIVVRCGFRPAVVLPLSGEAFPRTALGKIQRTLMRRRLETGEYAEQQALVDALVQEAAGAHTPPEGPVEEALVEIYAALFEVPSASISATGGFFEMGGTSLDILRLRQLIAARFPGNDLPVLTLLTASTPRELARRIDTGSSKAPTVYEPVVTLQTKGSKTPLFVVHPGVGEVLVFVNLAKYFAFERPFHALRARGFDGEPPFGSFAEMVGAYVDAIRRQQPHGPYALAGYSFGAAVAIEIAKVLEGDGEEVAFLGNFNLPAHIQERMNELDPAETANNLALFLDLITQQQAETLSDELRLLPADRQLAHLMEISDSARLAELGMDQERFAAWANLAAAMTNLGRTYEPTGRTACAMTVFCAEPLHGTKHDWLEHKLRRWDDYTSGPNRYVDIPGEHYTLMGPEHVTTFQAILRAELDRALSGR